MRALAPCPRGSSPKLQEKFAHSRHKRGSSAGSRRDVIGFVDPKMAFDIAAGSERRAVALKNIEQVARC